MCIYSLPISLLYFTFPVIALAVIEFRRIESYDYWLTMAHFSLVFIHIIRFLYSPRRVGFEWLCINIPNRWHTARQWWRNWIVIIHYRITFLVFHGFHRHHGEMSELNFSRKIFSTSFFFFASTF